MIQILKNNVRFWPMSSIVITTIWVTYAVVFIILKQYGSAEIYINALTFVGEVGLDLLLVIITFFLWKDLKGPEKSLFLLFNISFILLTVNDTIYNIVINILGITYFNSVINFAVYVPFLFFLALQLFIWACIFFKGTYTHSQDSLFYSYLPIIIIIPIVFVLSFITELIHKPYLFSTLGFYTLLDAILQILNFIFVLLCLSLAIDRKIRYIAIGYLLIMTEAFFVQTNTLVQKLTPRSFLEILWIFGLFLIIFGFYKMKQNSNNIKMTNWLGNINTMQAQCAFWSFLFCLGAFITFLAIGYLFAKDQLFTAVFLQHLPSMLIIFSIISVLISLIFARKLSYPFKRIENIIFVNKAGEKLKNLENKNKSNILEFINLEKFLNETFKEINEKNNAIKAIGAGIAHELRTPIRSIISCANGLEKYFPTLIHAYNLAREKGYPLETIYPHQLELLKSLNERLRNEGNSANIIVDMLLMNIREVDISKNRFTVLTMVDCITNALNRYSFQAGEKELIHFDTKNDFNFLGNELLIIHIIFNLIKNALYFISDAEKGEIFITIEKNAGFNKLYFKDTGKGISPEILPYIFDHFFSQTENGTGIGLSFCKMAMQRMGGNITCQSEVGKFTEFLLIFPVIKSKS